MQKRPSVGRISSATTHWLQAASLCHYHDVVAIVRGLRQQTYTVLAFQHAQRRLLTLVEPSTAVHLHALQLLLL
jgi:hypothetical protein